MTHDKIVTAPQFPSAWIYSKSSRNLKELIHRFPKQYDGEHIGRSWPDGWHPIVAGV